MCKSNLGWSLNFKMDTSVGWIIIKQKFNIEGNRVLAGVWARR